jgi:hypothetical protein
MKKLITITAIILLSLQFANAQKITIKAQGQTKTLTEADISYLRKSAPLSVVNALNNFKTGGTIQYNAAADVILAMLKRKV